MKARIALSAAMLLIMVLSSVVVAEEGMWPINELDKDLVKRMKELGLELSAKKIYDGSGGGISAAIVSLGGGTGSFVSPKGLILTNHHVAYTGLQRASDELNNYLRDGFHAKNFGEEIVAPGYRAYVLLSIKDVTKKVLSAVKDDMTPIERAEAIENRRKELVKKAEEGEDLEARISTFYDGMQYKLFTYFTIKDVRIVYAPPEAIGKYGGDIDNWMWPRHTGDFSFLRAYVAPDGSSAGYSTDNVPYEPVEFLTVSTKGVYEDDFTMVIGFPGRTQRYRTSYSIDYNQYWGYPERIKMFGDLLDIFHAAAETDPGVAIKVASLDAMLANAMKNNEGMLEGFERSKLLKRKLTQEKKFNAWLEENSKMQKKYSDVLPEIGRLYEAQKNYRDKNLIFRFANFACQMLRASNSLVKWSAEKEKPDLERDPGYMERDIPRLERTQKMIQMNYDPETDKKVLKYFLKRSLELPENQRIEACDLVLAEIGGADIEAKIDAYVEKLYAGTKLGTVEERMRMFNLSREELLAEGDAFIELGVSLEKEREELEERDKAFEGAITKLRPRLIEGYQKWTGGKLYPDANSTMRLTFGIVKGYSPREAIHYDYITSLAGVIEKHTGKEPFDNPEKLIELYKKGDYGIYADRNLGVVPVDFISTGDITGGNSGSPILNASGEVVGCIFDGNYESISSDYLFDEDLTRCISVDVRYVLFVLDKFSGADNLLDEMVLH
jgi:hypothetical protein